jgi:hypothetical protein
LGGCATIRGTSPRAPASQETEAVPARLSLSKSDTPSL